MIPFIDLKTQYQRYKTEIDAAVIKVMADAEFILGKEVQVLEQSLSEYTGAKHTIACANGICEYMNVNHLFRYILLQYIRCSAI